MIISNVQPDDEARWRQLWAGYLDFYEVDLAPAITDSTWQRIHDPSSRLACRVVRVDDRIAGFAIHHFHDSTWSMKPDCYLEDLYLDADYRGQGLGRALMDDLLSICRERGWSRLYWHTGRNNATARKLYDQYVKEDGHVRYRVMVD